MKNALLSVAFHLLLAPLVSAAVLVEWSTAELTEADSRGPEWLAGEVATGVKEGVKVTRGSGLVTPGTGAAETFLATRWIRGSETGPTDRDAALGDNRYFSFTIEPEAGHYFVLDALAFRLERNTSTGPDTFQLAYFIGDAVDEIAWIGSAVSLTGGTGGNGPDSFTISLAAVAPLQSVTGPITFRLYGWGATSPAGQARFVEAVGHPALQLAGEVLPIPEPSVVLLLGVAVLGAGCWRGLRRG